MKQTGAEILVRALELEGVEAIFGYPGGQVLPLYDALYSSGLRHFLVRHEQAAAHAADGYARATGRVGVCLATSGPGATNLVTGIATAFMDSVPLVAFTGQVPTGAIGKDAFQEADITGITLPITKHSFLVKDAKDIPRVVREAFHIASTGRPGPVLVDLPKDLQAAQVEAKMLSAVDMPSYKPTYQGHPKQITAAARAIIKAAKPVLYIGGGVITSGASLQATRLAEMMAIPVVTTLMGIGAIPSSHPLLLGMLGMHGTVAANQAVSGCDLLIAVGARFDDRATGNLAGFAPDAVIVHIDIDPAEISKNVTAHIPIVGDARIVLEELLSKLEDSDIQQEATSSSAWTTAAHRSLRALPSSHAVSFIKPQSVIESLYDLTQGEAIIATEVGQHQMWAAQYWRTMKPRHFITSGGLGTMGYGLPAAMGAQVGRPGELVIDIAGDGSFQMNMQELATLMAYELPVKVVILNNGCLGMVRQWQRMFYEKRYSHVGLAGTPDFIKLADSFGIPGFRASHADEVGDVLRTGIRCDGPAVMEVLIHPDEDVLPIVPPGAGISKMIGGDR